MYPSGIDGKKSNWRHEDGSWACLFHHCYLSSIKYSTDKPYHFNCIYTKTNTAGSVRMFQELLAKNNINFKAFKLSSKDQLFVEVNDPVKSASRIIIVNLR